MQYDENGKGDEPLRQGEAGYYDVVFASENVLYEWGESAHDAILTAATKRPANDRCLKATIRKRAAEPEDGRKRVHAKRRR